MKFVGVHVLPDGQVEAVREGILDATIKFANGAREAIATVLEIFPWKKGQKSLILGSRRFIKENVECGGGKVGP